MAGKIDFTVSANADKALSDLAKVINKQDKMIDKLKEQNRQAKKTGKSFSEAGKPLSKMVGDVASMAAGFISAQAAIGGFKAIVGQLKTEMDYFIQKSQRAGQGQFGFAQATTEAVRTTFGTGNLDKNIGAFYSSLPSNISPQEIAPLLSAYKGAYPQLSDPNQFTAAMSANAGPVSPAGRVQQIGLTGQLQSLMPGYSPNDAASVASMLINQTGTLSASLPAAMPGIFQLSTMGADPENILSRMVTGAQNKVKPRGFTSMASTLQMLQMSSATYKRSPGSPANARGQLYEGIRSAGGHEDINALMGFLDDLPADQWKYISSGQTIRPMFGPGVVAGGRAGIRGAISNNLAMTEAAQISGSGIGGFARSVETGAASVERMRLENRGGLTGQISSLVASAIADMPGRSELATRIDSTMLNAKWALGADPAEAAISYLGGLENQYGATQSTYVGGMGGMGGGRGSIVQGPNPSADPALVATLQQLQATIAQMADAYETMNENKVIGAGID